MYEQPQAVNLDKSKALGVDHGVDNWLTCVSNIGTSFNDILPSLGEKPEGWEPSGNRSGRLFKSAQGILMSADCQGAANIIKKVSTIFGLVLDGVRRL
ncbi:hypothetical protein [Cylindrospermopsis raciborskii]|uniref:hypothetical protein n=1 Tax=Cylindrospermopsis raciborskii TaxID=77022 RepID=UPI0011789E5D|nr:hypothetical protein [Cylindrospermopsis raciborskii]